MNNLNGTSRDGAVVARRAHNPKVTGSSPVPATKPKSPPEKVGFFMRQKDAKLA
jgi:hypothetical protein